MVCLNSECFSLLFGHTFIISLVALGVRSCTSYIEHITYYHMQYGDGQHLLKGEISSDVAACV